MDTSFGVYEAVAAFAGGGEAYAGAHADVERFLASDRLKTLAAALDAPPPDAGKRRLLATNQPLQLKGQPQALQPRTARLVASLADELQLDEELVRRPRGAFPLGRGFAAETRRGGRRGGSETRSRRNARAAATPRRRARGDAAVETTRRRRGGDHEAMPRWRPRVAQVLELLARVTDRQRRRDLSSATRSSATALDDDVAGAARRLFYFEASCSLRALAAIVRGALDDDAPEPRRRVLGAAARAACRAGLAPTLHGAVKKLASASWSHPADRAKEAGALASLCAEVYFYAFYEIQLEAKEALELLDLVPAAASKTKRPVLAACLTATGGRRASFGRAAGRSTRVVSSQVRDLSRMLDDAKPGAAAERRSRPSVLALHLAFKRTAPAVQRCKN